MYTLEAASSFGLGSRSWESLTLCYVIQQEDAWLMGDSGCNDKGYYGAICRELDALGISLTDIRWPVIAHYHPDHRGLASSIKAASGARVVMHQDDRGRDGVSLYRLA